MATRSNGNNSRARNSSNYRRRKKKKPNYAPQVVLVIFVLVIAALAVWAFGLMRKKDSAVEETTTTTVAETKIEQDITIDGISIKNMTQSDALSKVSGQYNWGMKAVLDADSTQTIKIDNMIEAKVNKILEEIYASSSPKSSYELSFDDMDAEIENQVETIKSQWNVTAKNGTISGFDKASGEFTYAGEEKGLEIDAEKLKKDIAEALSKKDFLASITVSSHAVEPEITKAQAKEMYKTIGTYTTNTTSNNDRNNNINLACNAIDGLVLQPGEEFSFNNTTGNRTEARGYKAAGAYVNGVVVTEPGGGVCQVSSTLYNAVIFSGLQTTERHAHTFEPSYVTPGEDAMVSYDGYAGPDMKFINTSSAALVIRARYADRKVTMSIIGIPILEDGVTISMHSEKVAEYDEPAPTYIEDQTLQPDVEVLAKAGTKGSRWVTNIIKKKNGEVVSDEFFHNSTYKGHAPEVKRNTSGIVLTPEGETSSVDPSASSETIESILDPAQTTAVPSPSEGVGGGPGVSPTVTSTVAQTQGESKEVSPTAAPTVAPSTAASTDAQPTTSEKPTTAAPAPAEPTTAGSTVETVPPAPGA